MKNIPFEIIGHIMILREIEDIKIMEDFARKKMQKHPYIRTVLVQTSKIYGKERKRKLKFLLGEEEFETTYREHGNRFLLNPIHTFFSPKLSYERQRIANLVKEGETILNFFAGVGPFDVAISTKQCSCKVHSIEINEIAYDYLCKNIVLNKCQNNIYPYSGDAFVLVPKLFYNKIDRVLLPLPLEAEKSLPVAYQSLKKKTGVIHWQITKHVQTKQIREDDVKEKIHFILRNNEIKCDFTIKIIRFIRWLSPRIGHFAVDLHFSN